MKWWLTTSIFGVTWSALLAPTGGSAVSHPIWVAIISVLPATLAAVVAAWVAIHTNRNVSIVKIEINHRMDEQIRMLKEAGKLAEIAAEARGVVIGGQHQDAARAEGTAAGIEQERVRAGSTPAP